MFPAPEATPSPTLQRHHGPRTAACPQRGPGTHRPAAGSKRAELHNLQGPVGRDRHLFIASQERRPRPNTRLQQSRRGGGRRRRGMQGGQADSIDQLHVVSPVVPCGSRRSTPPRAHDDRRGDGGTESGTASVLLGVGPGLGAMALRMGWGHGAGTDGERIPISPGQGEIRDGETPSPMASEVLPI